MKKREKDIGRKRTEKLLASLEKKLKSVYAQAKKDAEKKFNDYMADFHRKDIQHKLDVEKGKWSQTEYDNWRRNQLLYSKTLSQTRDSIAHDLLNADKIARQMAKDSQYDIYALNYNFGTYEIEHGLGIDTSFNLYDRDTVRRLITEDPDLLPPPSRKRQAEIDASDLKWNRQKLHSALTSSILNGDSIPETAKKISNVAVMDWHSAVRNARTMTTSAENGGRNDSYHRCKDMGIPIKKQWVAMMDSVTRDSHRDVDGEVVEVGEQFSNGLEYPGDSAGPPSEVYNCRCTMVAVIEDIDPMSIVDKNSVLQMNYDDMDMDYDSWVHEHDKNY